MMRITEYYRCKECGFIKTEVFKDGSDCCGAAAYTSSSISSMNADTEKLVFSQACPKCGAHSFEHIERSEVPEDWEPEGI